MKPNLIGGICVQFQSPHYTKDVEALQKKVHQDVPGLQSISHKEKLDKLGLYFSGASKAEGRQDRSITNRSERVFLPG